MPLRLDVRVAACKVWRWVFLKARDILGDPDQAAEALEYSVRSVSRYLEKKSTSLNSAGVDGLLALAAYRYLHRLARRRRRITLVGNELAEILRAPDWRSDIDRRLFVEELARELDVRSRGILKLRMEGFDWKEIGQMLEQTAEAVRKAFWRDVRRAHLRLLRAAGTTGFKEP